MWRSIQFESESSSSGVLSETDETAKTNIENDTEIAPKKNFSYTLDHSASCIHQDIQSLPNTEFRVNTKQQIDELSENCWNYPNLQKDDNGCVIRSNVTEPVLKNECQLFEIKCENLTQYQQIERKTEMYLRGKNFGDNFLLAI